MEANQFLITQTIHFVKQQLRDAEGGHDWFHIERVWKLAKNLASHEKANLLVVELGALLHDIADAKFHGGDESIGPNIATKFLESQGVSSETIAAVVHIIQHISFSSSLASNTVRTPELDIVQDADRLDALGAIGIARAFHFGGFKNRRIYDPSIPPQLDMDKETYKKNQAPTINHFYEKLFLLKDKMNTPTGKTMALERHQFMVQFIDQFYQEWDGLL